MDKNAVVDGAVKIGADITKGESGSGGDNQAGTVVGVGHDLSCTLCAKALRAQQGIKV